MNQEYFEKPASLFHQESLSYPRMKFVMINYYNIVRNHTLRNHNLLCLSNYLMVLTFSRMLELRIFLILCSKGFHSICFYLFLYYLE